MRVTVKRIWNWINGVLFAAVILLMIALVGVRLVGLQPYVVLSGSMEPTYRVGALVYVQTVEQDQLQVGDAVTYTLDGKTLVTHRIVEVQVEGNNPNHINYITQGDANPVPDGTPVRYRNIIGKVVFSIPYLGYLSNYIQNPPGEYVAIATGACFILMMILPDIIFPEGKKGKKREGERK